eukprot:scaffold103773_cov28-Tisochrysis_lutea.AAC.1
MPHMEPLTRSRQRSSFWKAACSVKSDAYAGLTVPLSPSQYPSRRASSRSTGVSGRSGGGGGTLGGEGLGQFVNGCSRSGYDRNGSSKGAPPDAPGLEPGGGGAELPDISGWLHNSGMESAERVPNHGAPMANHDIALVSWHRPRSSAPARIRLPIECAKMSTHGSAIHTAECSTHTYAALSMRSQTLLCSP